MASPILRVPPEILRMIFAPLLPRDLYAVCLTHRVWYIVAEPFLYSRIEWTWKNSLTPPIAQFLRSIVHKPERGSFVHAVTLNGDRFTHAYDDYKNKCPKLPVAEAVLDKIVKRIERIRVPYAEQWIQELRAGTMDALIAFLLSLFPNVKYLYLGETFSRESHLISMVLRSAFCEESQDSHLPSFKHLQDVSIVYGYPGMGIRRYTDVRNTVDALRLFYMPSVERLRAVVDNPITFMWPEKYPPNPLRLVSLDLAMLREGHLGQVLSITRGLRRLQWDWHYRPDLEDRFVTDIIDLDQIAADLSNVQETLTELSITAGSNGDVGDIECPELTFSGSFKTFSGLHMLEKLEVPIAFLLGFSSSAPNVAPIEEALPKNIQWLTITDELCFQNEWQWDIEGEYILEALRPWLQGWKKSTPRLQGLRLVCTVVRFREWSYEMIQGLRGMGIQAGIQINLIERERWMPGEM
ncbi:hypothetical protein BDV26DRAFT_305835 [Aspergillus bertholletiae]|uniref:F-box domain-containing protein n=1 Tax=Aspergillus bertholletiae TaxID=1226010 RepID=A0A5N7B228_9EURO|nr:hypothetical protein BDV26DRAFT_305835 [Aspergillus bertholletiae]